MFIDKKTLAQAVKLTFKKGYFHPRRFAFITAITPLYMAVRALDSTGRWMDDVFFDAYKDTDIGEPIFIMASPRSGTTLLHRLMSLDDQFTSYSLWQTILPTLTAYKAVDGLTKLDGALGSPLDKIQEAAAKYLFRGWEGIHETRFNQAEEDEAIFALQLGTPAVWLAWPFVEELPRPGYIDRLDTREQYARFLEGTTRRHM